MKSSLTTSALAAVLLMGVSSVSLAQNAPNAPRKPMIAVAAANTNLPMAPYQTAQSTPPGHGVAAPNPGAVVPMAAGMAGPAVFDVRADDQTLRDVLVRWSANSGWVHAPEHWAVDRDLPVFGTADASLFGTDYKSAVRLLLSSSDLTDRPVQPCFYTNRVVRVVPKAELCDRTTAF